MPLPTIFCPRCDTLILDVVQCPVCQWRRPVAVGEVGKPAWAVALEVKLPRKGARPVAAGTFVYTPTDKGQIVALDVAVAEPKEAIRWRHQLDARYHCPGVALWDEYLLPGSEYTGGFPAPQGALSLLSAENGDEVWQHPVEGASLSVPTIYDGVALFTVNTGQLYAVDLAARQELWRREIGTDWSWAPAAPLLTPTDLLILPSRSDQLVAFDIEKGEIAWTFSGAGWFPHPPVWLDGVIYIRCWDRHLYALNVVNGQEVWRHQAPRDFSSDLGVDEAYLYIGAKDYQGGADSGPRAYALYILDRQTGQRVGRYEVQGHILARPVATKDAVFFATDDRSREIDSRGTLYALDTHDVEMKTLLWQPCMVEQRFQSDLLLVNDWIVAGTRQGAVYAIRWRTVETTPQPPPVYIERNEWEDAAIAHVLRGEYTQAAEIYAQKLDQPLQAGRLYLHAGKYREVIELLGQSEAEEEKALAIGAVYALPEAKDRAEVLRDLGEYLVAATAYKEAGDWLAAAGCYREAQVWDEARAAYQQAGAWDQWSELTRELEEWEDLVERYAQTDEYAQAAEIYAEKLGLFLEAADYYDRAGLYAEALAAYRRVNPEKLTVRAQRRLAELAGETGEIDVALEAYRALGELTKAAEVAETANRYEQALALYQEIDHQLKMAEMLEQLARYAEAARIFEKAKEGARAAENWRRQAEQEIERVGVRYVDEQVEQWLDLAMALFEEEETFAEDEAGRDHYRERADQCRVELMQIRREPLLQLSLQAEGLLHSQGNAVHYVVKNVGWGTARDLTLIVSGSAFRPVAPLHLGSLKSGREREGTLSVVPEIAGEVMLRVELRGQAKTGDLQQFLTETVEVAQSSDWLANLAALDIQHTGPGEKSLMVSEPLPAWDDSDSDVSDRSDVVSQNQLEVESLRRQLAKYRSNLNKLRERAASYGTLEVPLSLENDIENHEQIIAEIEDRLQEFEG